MIIRRIGVLSVAKISAAIYAAIGLIFGLFVSLFSMLGVAASMGGGMHDAGMLGALFGVGAIVMMPLFYGAMGFIIGVISAFIYNLAAGFVGGIEIEVE